MSCAVMCDTLVDDDGETHLCVHCGATFPDRAPGVWYPRALASNGVPFKPAESQPVAFKRSEGGTGGTGQPAATLLGAPRPPFAQVPSRGVTMRTILGVQLKPDRPGATWHVAEGRTLARYLRPLYARSRRLNKE